MIEPHIGKTYRSTHDPDDREAITVVWVTADGGAIMVGHEGGLTGITREQWEDWCERVKAEEWTDNPPHLTHEISDSDMQILSGLDTLDKALNG